MTASGLFFFLVSLFLAIGFGISAAALARVKDVGGAVVAVLIGIAAEIVLIAELLSIFSFWKQGSVLVLQIAALAATALLARRHGDLSGPRESVERAARDFHVRKLWQDPLTLCVCLVLLGVLAIEFFLAVGSAPNTWDSMTYHLTRAVFWLQNDSIMQFPGATERQAAFPVNAEVLQGWTLMFAHGDRFVQLVQFAAQLTVVGFIFAAARDLGANTRSAIYAAAAFIAMPVVVAQSMSSQNDLILAAFASATFLFLLRGLKGDRGALVLAAAAAGLTAGTKANGFLVLFVIAIAAVVANGRQWRNLVRPLVYLAIGVLLLGTLNYGQNIVKHGKLIPAKTQDQNRVKSVKQVPRNALDVAWTTTMSFPGVSFGVLQQAAQKGTNKTLQPLASSLSGKPHSAVLVNNGGVEDRVGLGLPYLLLVLPALIMALIRWRQRDGLAFAIASIGTFAAVCVTLSWNEFIGRFGITSAALGVPLVALIAKGNGFRMLALIAVILTALPMSLQDSLKPFWPDTGTPIYKMDRIAQQTIIKTDEAGALRKVQDLVPEDGRIGIVGGEDSWEYPYAGPNLKRTLVKVPVDAVGPGVFDEYNIDALLLVVPFQSQPEFITAYADDGHVLIMRQKPNPEAKQQPQQ